MLCNLIYQGILERPRVPKLTPVVDASISVVSLPEAFERPRGPPKQAFCCNHAFENYFFRRYVKYLLIGCTFIHSVQKNSLLNPKRMPSKLQDGPAFYKHILIILLYLLHTPTKHVTRPGAMRGALIRPPPGAVSRRSG